MTAFRVRESNIFDVHAKLQLLLRLASYGKSWN